MHSWRMATGGQSAVASVMLMLCGCAARSAPMTHVPVKQEYASERAARGADDADFVLRPELGERLLRVEASGLSSRSLWRAVFYSDGTLQAEARPYDGPTQRSSAQLTAAELQRLKADMPALESCRRNAAACVREDDMGAAHIVVEVLAGPMRGRFVEHVTGARAPTDFLHYEAFVLGMVAQALGEELR